MPSSLTLGILIFTEPSYSNIISSLLTQIPGSSNFFPFFLSDI